MLAFAFGSSFAIELVLANKKAGRRGFSRIKEDRLGEKGRSFIILIMASTFCSSHVFMFDIKHFSPIPRFFGTKQDDILIYLDQKFSLFPVDYIDEPFFLQHFFYL
jgi:hypothetical protein